MQRRVLRYSVVNFALAGRQNLNPLTLRVGNERRPMRGFSRIMQPIFP